MKESKFKGQIFTPTYMAKNIIDFSGINKEITMLKHHIMDNSCGEGAFLCEIVKLYCEKGKTILGYSNETLKKELETYIHGIEIDKEVYEICIDKLNKIVSDYGIKNVKWDIINDDALSVNCYNNKMDFVIGNPPYVRIHNLGERYNNVKSFSFAKEGDIDLYLAFFELGFNMLNENGILCYITPNSWLTTQSGKELRKYIVSHKNLVRLCDLEHFQIFNASTYCIISLFENNNFSNNISYYRYDIDSHKPIFKSSFSIDEMNIQDKFYIGNRNSLSMLKSILEYDNPDNKKCIVKNGFSTNADNIYIGNNIPDTTITIPILKASTGKWHKCLFPYDKINGNPIPIEKLFQEKVVKNYFEKYKSALTKYKTDDMYVYYGRSQAIKDINKTRFAINNLIKDKSSIKLEEINPGCGIYSGLYILTSISEEKLKEILMSDDFFNYISALKKYKSGNYYTFNSKDLEQFLNFKLKDVK